MEGTHSRDGLSQKKKIRNGSTGRENDKNKQSSESRVR